MSGHNQPFYKFKEFKLNVAERLLLRDEANVPLTPKVFDVLALLVERGGHLVEKDELLRVCWEDSFVEESNVARVVHSLRKILGENADNKFIETVPKKGYRFVAEVEKNGGARDGENGVRLETQNVLNEPDIFFPPPNGDYSNGDERQHDERKREIADADFFRPSDDFEPPVETAGAFDSKISIFVAALLVFAFLTTGIFLYRFNSSPVDKIKQSKSIAVLPLKPINIDNRDSIYELGIAESLILKLSAGNNLIVRPLSATRRYLELEQNPTDAGREQQVDFVLSSNYQIANGKIRVTSQLINIQTGSVDEVFKTEKDSVNVFAMQDAVADEIGNTLLARFGTDKNNLTARRGTSSEQAYRLYLQAAFIFDQWNKADIGKAIEYLEQAVRIDPNYAEAYTMLGYAYRYFASKSLSPSEQSVKARAAIEKALALDENLADARAVWGLLKFSYEGELTGAEREFERALELNPESPMALGLYAYFLMSVGRFDEAININKKAIEVDPGSLAHQITYGMILYYAHRFDEVAAHYEKLLQKNKNFAYGYFWMWLASDLRGDEAQAYKWFMLYQTQMKAAPETLALYQNAYQKAGWKGILLEMIAQDEQKLEIEDNAGYLYEIACFSARVGNREKALEYLEKAAQARSTAFFFIKVDPYLTSLHGDPRFEKLIEKARLN